MFQVMKCVCVCMHECVSVCVCARVCAGAHGCMHARNITRVCGCISVEEAGAGEWEENVSEIFMYLFYIYCYF